MKSFDTVAIVGVGLIGGSIGLGMRERGLAREVIGIGRTQKNLRTARRLGAVTHTTVDLAKGVAEADLVLVCTPVGRVVEDIKSVAKNCPPRTLISDVGSTKRAIVEAMDQISLPGECRFLGAHPMAGRETVGAIGSDPNLFEGKVVVLTPTPKTQADDFDLLEQLWSQLGAVVVQMDAAEHDRAVALTSHLPHAVAVALAASVPEEWFRMVGTGMLDTSRLAAGGPEIWKDIFLDNSENVLMAMDRFGRHLTRLVAAIRGGDEADLVALLSEAREIREAFGNRSPDGNKEK
jgi:prephenate dehydrogenase